MKNSKWTKQRLYKPAEVFSCLYMLLAPHSEFKLGGSFIIIIYCPSQHTSYRTLHHIIQTYLENIIINLCSRNTVIICRRLWAAKGTLSPGFHSHVSGMHISLGDWVLDLEVYIRAWILILRSWCWGIDQMKAHCLCSPLLHYEGHHIILDGWLVIREAWFWFDELYMKSAPFNPLPLPHRFSQGRVVSG